ncbi:DUF1838 domain-containing protein [Parahaliea maris]|uniref:DUF1838 domain-containing protein n=1 Tax=Parahaliea maris TaxID=2716870 RepID=A0A5C8ZWK5_9GAMM|nr:DUF1838 family protein [Parahaliea maris]TXS91982.1 DUF1838 domain-containing protein [Parahaliea maris]
MTQKLSRRSALGLMGATAAGAVLPGQMALGAGGVTKVPDLADAATLSSAFRKTAYSMDEKVYFWWLRGTRFGVVDAEATPFWDMYVGTWFTTKDLGEGDYEVTMAGANFYTPPGSTELLESFQNPYTGETVPVSYRAPKPWKTVMGPEGGAAFAPDMPGMKMTRSTAAGPGWIEGDDVVIRGDMLVYAEPLDPDSDKKAFRVNDWSTYVAKLSDVADPAVKSAPCVQYFTDILTWPKWLNMGDQPGSYVSRCFGRKVASVEEMPATWRKLFAQALPEAAKDPVSLLQGA